jgi:hypothetical protein
MNDVHQLIADFFKSCYESQTGSVWSFDQNSRRLPAFVEIRAEIFKDTYNTYASERTGGLWSELSCKVYKVASKKLSVIVALYGDKDILWLDNHSDDSDFEILVRRERLIEWLPYRLDELLDLLIETKLNYLLWPLLVRMVSEVPPYKEEYRALSDPEFVVEMDKRLAKVANQIQPPRCVRDRNGAFQLSFCVWTKVLGRVIRIDCTFGPNHSFRYESTQLTDQVGMFTGLR